MLYLVIFDVLFNLKLLMMNHLKKGLFLIIIYFMYNGINSAQSINKDIDNRKIALEIINKADFCALITLDNEGIPEARMMQTLPTDHDFVIWLATKPNTRKVEQIKQNSKVGVYYTGNESSAYVYIKGNATLVNDILLKKKYWKEGWESFYPDMETDMILIKISPLTAQIVSYTHGIVSEELNWSAPIINIKSIENEN
jgi:general stress protein 26